MSIIDTNSIPEEIIKAALQVDGWMHEHGHHRWELMGTCSRNHAYELAMLKNSLELFYAEIVEPPQCSTIRTAL